MDDNVRLFLYGYFSCRFGGDAFAKQLAQI